MLEYTPVHHWSLGNVVVTGKKRERRDVTIYASRNFTNSSSESVAVKFVFI